MVGEGVDREWEREKEVRKRERREQVTRGEEEDEMWEEINKNHLSKIEKLHDFF